MKTGSFITASAVTMAVLLAGGASLAQSDMSGAGAGSATGGGEAAEQNPAEITCREIVAMDTAAVPGVLYFISGHRAGQGGILQQDGGNMASGGGTAQQQADQAAAGNTAGAVTDASGGSAESAQDGAASGLGEGDAMQQADEAAAGNTAGAMPDPSGSVETAQDGAASGLGESDAMQQADEAAAGNTAGAMPDPSGSAETVQGGATSGLGEGDAMQQADEAAAANTGGAVTEAGGVDAAGQPLQGEGSEAVSGGARMVTLTRLAGYFEIPVEQTMIACQQAPEMPASDVIEQQRSGSQGSGN